MQRSTPILLAAAAATVVCTIGWLALLRVDTNWYESFGENSRVIRWIRFLENHIKPSETLELAVTLPTGEEIYVPENLEILARLTNRLSSIDGLGRARSILDILRRLNRLLHDDDPALERTGTTSAANAQLVELIDLENPQMLSTWLSFDRRTIRISIDAPEQSFMRRGQVVQAVHNHLQDELPVDWSVLVSGEAAIGFDWIRDVQTTQLRSFPTAFLLVFGIAALLFRSVGLAAAAMVPTTLPAIAALGVMGWAGMSLDVGRAMVAAVILGIAVDDSIHFLSHYVRLRSRGHDVETSLQRSLLHTGSAIVTTSLALSLGFLTLMASAWQTISSFGFLVSVSIIGALVSTLFVLPALLIRTSRISTGRSRWS
jgi:predicted RND superfamily exporter protein